MNSLDDSEDYDYFIFDDGLGISHVVRRPKRVPPTVRCVGCE